MFERSAASLPSSIGETTSPKIPAVLKDIGDPFPSAPLLSKTSLFADNAECIHAPAKYPSLNQSGHELV